MGVIPAFDQLACSAEHFGERRRVVTDDRQSAAPFGTVGSECPYDHVPAGTHRAQHTLDIGGTIFRFSQEMKAARSCHTS